MMASHYLLNPVTYAHLQLMRKELEMSNGQAELDFDSDTLHEVGEEYDQTEPEYQEDKEYLGVVYQEHPAKNYGKFADMFYSQMAYGARKENLPRNEPGDMAPRGVWMRDGDFMYLPYSQMSCAYGECIVNRKDHLDRAVELVKKYRRIFLFTTVSKSLLDAVKARPNDFVPLCTTESWMEKGSQVPLFATVFKE